ncbi:MAG: GDP-mannose 4,6-dehydratase [Anaerolineae bacterium]
MTRILITGITGFTGVHLANHLLTQGAHVFGFSDATTELPPALTERVSLYSGDIRHQATLEKVLAEVQPDIIYHLAGLLKAAKVEDFYQINVLGTIALFEAIITVGLTSKVLITSSSAVYGKGVGSRPITEQFQLRPITHYGVSKVAQEAVAQRYYLTHRLPVVTTRAFNLLGPGQPPTLACSAFARQIALAEQSGAGGDIITGNLSAWRDFTDVRDAVQAYELIARQGKAGDVYNVCSQQAVSTQTCLEILICMACVPLKATLDPARAQANDVPLQIGSAAKLVKQTGWRAKITLQQSLADLLNDWRQKVRT